MADNNDNNGFPEGVITSANRAVKGPAAQQPAQPQGNAGFPNNPSGAMPVSQFLNQAPPPQQAPAQQQGYHVPPTGQFAPVGQQQQVQPQQAQGYNVPPSGQFPQPQAQQPQQGYNVPPSGQFPQPQQPATTGKYSISAAPAQQPVQPAAPGPTTGKYSISPAAPAPGAPAAPIVEDVDQQKYTIRATSDETASGPMAQLTSGWRNPDDTPTQKMRIIFGASGFIAGGLAGILLGILNSALQGATFTGGLGETFMIAVWFALFMGIAGGAFPDRMQNVLRQHGLMD